MQIYIPITPYLSLLSPLFKYMVYMMVACAVDVVAPAAYVGDYAAGMLAFSVSTVSSARCALAWVQVWWPVPEACLLVFRVAILHSRYGSLSLGAVACTSGAVVCVQA